MKLSDITDIGRCATALEGILNCLQRLCPPVYPEASAEPPAKPEQLPPASNEQTFDHELNDQLSWIMDSVQMIAKEYGDDLSAYREKKDKGN